jgi:phosphohistidine phosphatase
MYLYLIRHGEASSDDGGRSKPKIFKEPGALTEKGRETVRKLAVFLKKKGVKIDEIWHSVKLRAKQTAEIIADEFDVENVYKKNFLAPLDPVDKCVEKMSGYENLDLAIVSHIPYLSNLIAYLVPVPGEIIDFKQAGVVCLELTGAGWQIAWMSGAQKANARL